MPSDADDNAAQARFEDGVVMLSLPKTGAAQLKQLAMRMHKGGPDRGEPNPQAMRIVAAHG